MKCNVALQNNEVEGCETQWKPAKAGHGKRTAFLIEKFDTRN